MQAVIEGGKEESPFTVLERFDAFTLVELQ